MTRVFQAALLSGLLLSAPLHAADIVLDAPGADEELREDLRAASLAATAVEEGTTDGQELLAAARADYRRLVAALYENGHFGGSVSILFDGREAADINILREVPSPRTITLRVAPGPTFTFSEARVAPLPPTAEPAEGFAPGQPATTPVMRRAAQGAVGSWRDIGHAKAEVSGQQITANHPNRTVAARIAVAPGPKLRFGKTLLTPESLESAVRQTRIRAIAGIPEGETFSPAEVDKAERRLRRTGAFRSATVDEAEVPNPDATLDMIVDVEDARPRRFGVGAELSSNEGLALTAFWLHRNLLGGAERFRVDGEVKGIGGDSGGIDYRLTASLTKPAYLHPDNNLRYGVNLEHLEEPTYTSDLIEATVALERFVNDNVTVESELGLRYDLTEDQFGTRDFRHVTFRNEITWDNRNDDLNPTKGGWASFEALPYLGVAGSESGARFEGDFRGYAELGSERFSIAGRVRFGSIIGTSTRDTPPDYLFFSGGGGSVRGQDYQSLGGSVVAGQVVGGRSFATTSVELRTLITDTIGAVAFVDYGYVSPDSDFSGGDYHGGAGLGARYFTPIGPIRLDVAVPTTGESGFGVYVGIGQAF